MLKFDRKLTAFCEYPFTRLKVTCEGNVTMCCFQTRACLGNLLRQSLEDIWFSKKAEQIRKETEEGRLHKLCKVSSCPFFRRNHLQDKVVSQKKYPSQFEIDIPTQHCNIGGYNPTEKNPACIMCERHTTKGWHQNDRLQEVCEKLKPYMRYVEAVHIQGIAEPFWKDYIFDVLSWLDFDKYKSGCRVTSTTNGTVMTEKRRERFLQYPRSNLVWSLDAGSPEIYKKIRRVDMYDKIIENLKAYSYNRNSRLQEVMIHNNINLINIGDVEKMVEAAAYCNVDRLDINATYAIPKICVNERNADMFRDAQKRIMEKAREVGVYVTFMRDLSLNFGKPVSWHDVSPVEVQSDLVQIKMPQ